MWCTISHSDMLLPTNQRTKLCENRSLQTMNSCLEKFRSQGSKPLKAKDFYNVVREPLMGVPLVQLCIPGLHISLGLFLKHFNSFESSCHELDNAMSTKLSEEDTKLHHNCISQAKRNFFMSLTVQNMKKSRPRLSMRVARLWWLK